MSNNATKVSTLAFLDCPLWIMDIPGMGGSEIKVVLCLFNALRHQSDGTFNRKGWLTQGQIRTMTGFDAKTVQKAVSTLRERGIITTERSKGRDARLIYTLTYRWPSPSTLKAWKQNKWKEYVTERAHYSNEVRRVVVDALVPAELRKSGLPFAAGFYSLKFWRIACHYASKGGDKKDPKDIITKAAYAFWLITSPSRMEARGLPVLTPDNPEGVFQEVVKYLVRSRTDRALPPVLKPYGAVLGAIEDKDVNTSSGGWRSLHELLIPDLAAEATPMPALPKPTRKGKAESQAPEPATVSEQEAEYENLEAATDPSEDYYDELEAEEARLRASVAYDDEAEEAWDA